MQAEPKLADAGASADKILSAPSLTAICKAQDSMQHLSTSGPQAQTCCSFVHSTALLTWTVQQCLLVSLPVNDLLNLCPDGNHSVTEPVQLSLQKAARSKQSGSKCSLQGNA